VKKNGLAYRDDIRLAKQFFKAQRMYGAESYIQGFSGHVVDILVIHSKGFIPFLRKVRSWKQKKIIDVNNIYKGRALHHLNVSKTTGPLIVIDPIQKERNAAAAVSKEKFNLLISSAKRFLSKPSKKDFQQKKFSLASLPKGAVIIQCTPKKGKNDVIGAKLLKVFERLRTELDKYGISKADWYWTPGERALLWFVLRKKELDREYLQVGPPARMKDAAKEFKKKHKKTITKKGVLHARVKRRYTRVSKELPALLKSQYIKERILRTRIVPKTL